MYPTGSGTYRNGGERAGKAALLAKGNDPRDVEQKVARVRSTFTAAGFTFWSDIQGSKVQNYLHGLQDGKDGMSAQTFNHYLQHVKQFCNWMVKDGRANASPVAYLQKLNAKTDRRHDRRALSVDELRRIIDSTETRPDAFGMPGIERALLYRLAVNTHYGTRSSATLWPAVFIRRRLRPWPGMAPSG
jgi:hypothetical protein